MSRRLLPFAALVAACASSSPPSEPARGSQSAPIATSRPPAPIPAGYAEASERTRRDGRAALALLAGNQVVELRALMTPALAKVATPETLASLHDLIYGAGKVLGTDEMVLVGTYRIDLKAGPSSFTVALAFDGAGKLSGLSIPSLMPPLPPDPRADRALKARLRLPFDGQWWVFWGGDDVTLNYHVATQGQRHAFDIVMWRDGGTYRGDGTKNEDYHCWGQPIVAPADATVITAVNDKIDNPPGTMDPSAPAGNHVMLDLGNREYALLAHMQQGSVTAKVGDKVTRGQRLGLTGNSGNTSEPHLHFHVQDAPELFDGFGLPVVFDDVCLDGKLAAPVSPVRGQFIEDCE
jgi:murein DD-endopeptidase MepM/ murein hydrolase activator NlpD